jgi:hypothetical protein
MQKYQTYQRAVVKQQTEEQQFQQKQVRFTTLSLHPLT